MKILFLSHDASRTGAPMFLFHVLQWFQNNYPQYEVDLIVLKGGPLEQNFRSTTQNYYNYSEAVVSKKYNYFKRFFLKIGFIRRPNLHNLFLSVVAKNNYDVVYANTILSIPLASELVKLMYKAKFIAHIHELNAVIKLFLPNLDLYINSIDTFITPAKIVKDNLIKNWAVPDENIEVIHECSIVSTAKLKLEENNFFTIGGSGSVHWRKGYDLFIQVARQLCGDQIDNNFKFIWVGFVSAHDLIIITEDLIKLGLGNKVFFVGEVENPEHYYNDFDLFLMTSREDPFPLVCIELGMLGKPIISFENATGINEFLKEGGGYIVPYQDINEMAKKVLHYRNSPELKIEHGNYNRKIFSSFHPNNICPNILSIIVR